MKKNEKQDVPSQSRFGNNNHKSMSPYDITCQPELRGATAGATQFQEMRSLWFCLVFEGWL